MKKIFLLSFFFIFGCGFHPLYQESSQAVLEGVFISPISGTRGIDLRQQLRQVFAPHGDVKAPTYRVEVNLHEPRVDLRGVRQDGTATWGTVIAKADVKLIFTPDESILLQNQETAFSSYQVLSSVYASMTASEDSYDRATETLGRQIISRVQARIAQRGAGEN
ncbi:MAG: hypothetical protein JXR30_01105 [Alphaproteobacteria bacterium]|nr:hypothetical protein [Alphaproteobacteria bacterium]